jgi:2-phosphosulfolactate phosphatase
MQWSCTFLSIDESRDVGGVVVAIDVMRAFTTAAWAFEVGVRRIILTAELEDALALKAGLPGALALKDGEPAPGFDLSTSPARIREREDLAGKTIVQRTTAGTVGAVAARKAERLYCASFVCAGATVAHLRRLGAGPVTFVVTGEGGKGEEDRACAEYIAGLLEDPALSPDPFLARAAASTAAAKLRERVAAGEEGVDPRDVAMCLEVDRFDFAMIARDESGLLWLTREYPVGG